LGESGSTSFFHSIWDVERHLKRFFRKCVTKFGFDVPFGYPPHPLDNLLIIEIPLATAAARGASVEDFAMSQSLLAEGEDCSIPTG
jgi:hypothetical protein